MLPLLVLAASVLAYWPAADAEFLNWDDGLTVTDNTRFRGFDAERLGWMWTTSHAGHYQPLSWMSLAADHLRQRRTPQDPPQAAGFHRTNIALHATGAVALYFLALTLLSLGTAGGPGRAPPRRQLALASAFAALVHAVHPLRCESVCWVTERRDVLSGVFFVLAVLAYLRGAPAPASTPAPAATRMRPGALALSAAAGAGALASFLASLSFDDPAALALRGPGAAGLALALLLLGVSAVAGVRAAPRRSVAWALLCPLLLLVSLLAKAWGIVMPALLLVIDVWPLRRVRDRRAALALLVEKAPFIALSLAFMRLAHWAQTAQQGSVDVWQTHGLSARVVQALYALAFYPAKTLAPFDLAPLHPIPESMGWLEPRFFVAALTSIGISVFLVVRARRHPAWLAAWVAYVIIVSPVLGVHQTGPQLVADRYTYLAGIPFALLAGGALRSALGAGGAVARAGLGAALAVVLALGVATWRQSAVWRSSESLWTHARRVGEPSALVALNLGLVRVKQAHESDDPERRAALRHEALALFEEGARLHPSYELIAINTASLLAEDAEDLPPPQRAEALERASGLADQAIRAAEAKGLQVAAYYLQHGRILLAQGRVSEAGRRFERAVQLRPEWPEARVRLGSALLETAMLRGERDPEAGLALIEQAIAQVARGRETDPRTGAMVYAMALDIEWRLLDHLGRADEAAASRARARDAYAAVAPGDPGYAEAQRRARGFDEPSTGAAERSGQQ